MGRVRVQLYINRVVFVSNFLFVDAESVKTSRYTLGFCTGQCALLGCRERTLIIDRSIDRTSSSDTVECRTTGCGGELNVSASACLQDFVYCSVETMIDGL